MADIRVTDLLNPIKARRTAIEQRTKPIKTRGLKKADREENVFSIFIEPQVVRANPAVRGFPAFDCINCNPVPYGIRNLPQETLCTAASIRLTRGSSCDLEIALNGVSAKVQPLRLFQPCRR